MRDHSNFKDDILKAAGGEPIEKIIIAKGDGYGMDRRTYPNGEVKVVSGKLLDWDVAAPMLDYEYYPGYGTQECHDFYAWTENRVLSVGEYDGSTWVEWAPRHPAADAFKAARE